MRWHRTRKRTAETWVAVGDDGERIMDSEGYFFVRYDPSEGSPIYRVKRAATKDPKFAAEHLPDGVSADSREGIIRRFCYTVEARSDWAFLDEWKRRRYTSITHAGCGDGSWPEIEASLPLTCPRCGVLRGDETLYAQWQTVRDPAGEGVKAIVYEAWLTSARYEYMKEAAIQGSGRRSTAAANVGAERRRLPALDGRVVEPTRRPDGVTPRGLDASSLGLERRKTKWVDSDGDSWPSDDVEGDGGRAKWRYRGALLAALVAALGLFLLSRQ